jgi:plasmid maintenance system killer protein
LAHSGELQQCGRIVAIEEHRTYRRQKVASPPSWASGNYRITFGWDAKDAINIDLEDYH